MPSPKEVQKGEEWRRTMPDLAMLLTQLLLAPRRRRGRGPRVYYDIAPSFVDLAERHSPSTTGANTSSGDGVGGEGCGIR